MLVLGFLAILLSYVSATKYGFSCVDRPIPLLTKLESIYLCIHFWPYNVKMGFPLLVDEYSVLEIPDSFDTFKNNVRPAPGSTGAASVEVYAQLDGHSSYSEQNIYYVRNQGIVQNAMHLIIQVKEGLLVGYRWDADCDGCNKTADCRTFSGTYWNSNTGASTNKNYETCTVKEADYTGDNKPQLNLKVNYI